MGSTSVTAGSAGIGCVCGPGQRGQGAGFGRRGVADPGVVGGKVVGSNRAPGQWNPAVLAMDLGVVGL